MLKTNVLKSLTSCRQFSQVSRLNNNMASQSQPKSKTSIGVVGFPFCKGSPFTGTQQAPQALREGGLVSSLERFGHHVVDHGDVTLDPIQNDEPINGLMNPRSCGEANKLLSESVSKILQSNQSVLALGGDRSMSIGAIHGHAQVKPDVVVVWLDAHADLKTPATSPTGALHGMPVNFLVKELRDSLPALPQFDWCPPCLSVRDIVHIGLRCVSPPERQVIEKFNMAAYSMTEIDRYGIGQVVEMALKQVDPTGRRPIHVALDIDVLDPSISPATGFGVPGGLTLREILYIAEEVAKTGRLSVLDVNEFEVDKDDRKLTQATLCDVINKFYGWRREGNVVPNFKMPFRYT